MKTQTHTRSSRRVIAAALGSSRSARVEGHRPFASTQDRHRYHAAGERADDRFVGRQGSGAARFAGLGHSVALRSMTLQSGFSFEGGREVTKKMCHGQKNLLTKILLFELPHSRKHTHPPHPTLEPPPHTLN